MKTVKLLKPEDFLTVCFEDGLSHEFVHADMGAKEIEQLNNKYPNLSFSLSKDPVHCGGYQPLIVTGKFEDFKLFVFDCQMSLIEDGYSPEDPEWFTMADLYYYQI